MQIMHDETHIEYTSGGRDGSAVGGAGGDSRGSSGKSDLPSPHPNGNGVPSSAPSLSSRQDNKMMMMDKAKSGVASAGFREAKRLPELPKTCKIFQLVVNVERSLGEFRRLLIPAFVKVLYQSPI